MSLAGLPDRRTPEEKYAYAKSQYDECWFEEGRTYVYELSNTWWSGWYPTKTMEWNCYIKQAECPWMIIANESFQYPQIIPGARSITYLRAVKWGKDYLKRKGPSKDYWGIRGGPPKDPKQLNREDIS